MKINWGQIITTVISTTMAAIIISAFTVIWKGATSVDMKVQTATENLENTVSYIQKAVEVIEEEIATSREAEKKLEEKISFLENNAHIPSFLNIPPDQSPTDITKKPEIFLKDIERMPIQQQIPELQYELPRH